MFIIAALKKPEEANIQQNSSLYFILIQALNKLLSLLGGLLAQRINPE